MCGTNLLAGKSNLYETVSWNMTREPLSVRNRPNTWCTFKNAAASLLVNRLLLRVRVVASFKPYKCFVNKDCGRRGRGLLRGFVFSPVMGSTWSKYLSSGR